MADALQNLFYKKQGKAQRTRAYTRNNIYIMEKLIGVMFAFISLSLFLRWCFELPAISYCDAAEPWDIFFQENASPISEGIVDFHDHLSYYLLLILVIVTWMLTSLVASSLKKRTTGTPFIVENKNSAFSARKLNEIGRATKISLKDLNHGSVIEIVWTITPAIILVLIAFPSFRLLYLMDEIVEPLITVKAIGFYLGL